MRKWTAHLSTTGIRMGLLSLCAILITIIAFYGCRKFDHPDQPDPSVSTEDKFFNANRSGDLAEKAIVDFVIRKNKELGFVEKTTRGIGFPYWKNLLEVRRANSVSTRSGDADSITTYYIPFVRDTQNYVNAAMVVKANRTDTAFSFVNDWQYKTLLNEEAAQNSGAEKFATFFMVMNREVFGHRYFKILDPKLFKTRGGTAQYVRLDTSSAGSSMTQRMVRICQPITIYFEDCPFKGNPAVTKCNPNCDRCWAYCLGYLSYDYCWEQYEDDLGTGTGGTGGGGGHPGDPGGGWDPEEEEPDYSSPPDEIGDYLKDAPFAGNSTYITSSGVPVTLPAGSKVNFITNIDRDIFPNGALYSFILPDGRKFVSIQKEYIVAGSTVVPKPEFVGYYEIDADTKKVDYHKPLEDGFITQPTPINGVVRAVRIRVQKDANNNCQVVRELIDYSPGTNIPSTYLTGANVNYGLEYPMPVAGITAETTALSYCPGGSMPGSGTTLQAFVLGSSSISSFLLNNVKSEVKIYLYDCTTGNAKYTITKTGYAAVPAGDQSTLLNKFNNNTFTSSDEHIAIKACIQDGQWQYDVKFNQQRLGSINPKIQSSISAVLAEIRSQADQEAQSIRGVERSNGAETILAGDGEIFYKAWMDLFKSISAIYDVGKHIINNGAMPEYIWDQGYRSGTTDTQAQTEYGKSPFHLPSVLSGGIDQLIDEATGAVQLVKMGFEAVRHPRETFDNVYNGIKNIDKEKIKQIVSSASGYTNYQAGGNRARYQGGRHSVQAAMILIGSVKLLTKGKEVVREGGTEMTHVQEFIPNGTTNHPAATALKNASDNNKLVKNIDNEKLLTRNTINNEEIIVGIEKKGTTSEVFEAKKSDFVDDNGNQLSDLAIDEALEEGAKDISYPLNGDNSYVRGQKNAWNKELNIHPLTPNKIYNVNGFKYYTDGSGKITKVEITNLQKSTPAWDRNRYQQSLKANKAKDGISGQDQGGHLIASQFGGPGEQINLVPMKKTLNQHPGTWAQMEQEWANTLNANGTVTNIEINIIYGSNGRPTGFTVVADVNGVTIPYNHTN